MATRLRRLNEQGLSEFREYLMSGAEGVPPLGLLENAETSEPVAAKILVAARKFTDRFEFGVFLGSLLSALDIRQIANDQGLWSALALIWFDELCPPAAGGKRIPDKEYRYILSQDYRHYYRHLIRSPWQLVRDHGDNARFLLISPREQKHPLSIHGEILEQFGGRQQVLASRPVIAAANSMYFDQDANRPRKGAAGSKGGSARRFGMVLRQLDLTYDAECMGRRELVEILPTEFDRWK